MEIVSKQRWERNTECSSLLLHKATKPKSAVLDCSIVARHVKHGPTLLQLSHPTYHAILGAPDSCFPVTQGEPTEVEVHEVTESLRHK